MWVVTTSWQAVASASGPGGAGSSAQSMPFSAMPSTPCASNAINPLAVGWTEETSRRPLSISLEGDASRPALRLRPTAYGSPQRAAVLQSSSRVLSSLNQPNGKHSAERVAHNVTARVKHELTRQASLTGDRGSKTRVCRATKSDGKHRSSNRASLTSGPHSPVLYAHASWKQMTTRPGCSCRSPRTFCKATSPRRPGRESAACDASGMPQIFQEATVSVPLSSMSLPASQHAPDSQNNAERLFRTTLPKIPNMLN